MKFQEIGKENQRMKRKKEKWRNEEAAIWQSRITRRWRGGDYIKNRDHKCIVSNSYPKNFNWLHIFEGKQSQFARSSTVNPLLLPSKVPFSAWFSSSLPKWGSIRGGLMKQPIFSTRHSCAQFPLELWGSVPLNVVVSLQTWARQYPQSNWTRGPTSDDCLPHTSWRYFDIRLLSIEFQRVPFDSHQ